MSAVIAPDKDLTVNFGPLMPRFSDEEYAEFCRRNPDLRIERTSEGDLIIMPPTGGENGTQNFYLTGRFSTWVERDGSGKGFDSSTEFSLPNAPSACPMCPGSEMNGGTLFPTNSENSFRRCVLTSSSSFGHPAIG